MVQGIGVRDERFFLSFRKGGTIFPSHFGERLSCFLLCAKISHPVFMMLFINLFFFYILEQHGLKYLPPSITGGCKADFYQKASWSTRLRRLLKRIRFSKYVELSHCFML